MENEKPGNIEDCIIMAFEKNNGSKSLEIVISRPVSTKHMMQVIYDAVKKYSPEYEPQERNGCYVYLNKKGEEAALYALNAKEDMADRYLIITNQKLLLFIKQTINENQCKEVY